MKNKSHALRAAICFSFVAAMQTSEVTAGSHQSPNSSFGEVIMSHLTSSPAFIQLNSDQFIPHHQFSNWIHHALKMDDKDDFVLYKTESMDELGFTLYRYQQTYNNIPVQDGIYYSHVRNGRIESVNGEYFKGINFSTQVILSEEQALQKALEFVGAKKYKWQDAATERQMKQLLEDPSFTYFPKAVKYIAPMQGDHVRGDYRVTYRFDVFAAEPESRKYVFVDAKTGEIVNVQERMHSADVTGTANTKYNGTQNITTDSYNGSYRLREAGRGKGIQTMNLNNGSSTGSATDFTDSDNNWTSTANQDDAATDAHWGAEKTYDYYKNIHNRKGIDNADMKMISYVHWGNATNNAQWTGSYMQYGDGDGTNYKAFTTLDVCGHEFTHGVTGNSAGLVYQNESGALNESFSDIMGMSIDWWSRPNQANWDLGEQMSVSGKPFRSMSNPNSANQPDTYKGTLWESGSADNGGVHTNSGVQNFWYYLLCVGGSGTNDNSKSYNVTGIGMAKAEKIAYRTLTVYLTSSSDYAAARTYSIQSAKDLYGDCSPEIIAVTKAWYAVGVGADYVAPALSPAFAAGKTSFCSLPATVKFTNTTIGGQTYQWDFGDGLMSNDAVPTHSYTKEGSYAVKLVVNGCGGGAKDSVVKTSYIIVQPPATPSATDAVRCDAGTLTLNASGSSANEINWYTSSSGGTPVFTGATFTTPALSATTTYYVDQSSLSSSQKVGPKDETIGSGGYLSNDAQYLVFDVLDSCTLISVLVNTDSAGTRTIELRDNTGATLQSASVNVPTGSSRVTLNFKLGPGNDYRLGIKGACRLYRNNNGGTAFPYLLNGLLSIKTTSVATNPTNYYYFYYDWEVKGAGCHSARVAVKAVVSVPSTPVITINAGNLQCSSAANYQWYFNGVAISGATSQTCPAGFDGSYTVEITDAGGCKAISDAFLVTGLSKDAWVNYLEVMPNPSNGIFYLKSVWKSSVNVKLEVRNTIGQCVWGELIDSSSIQNKTIDLSYLPSGVYLFQISSEEGIATKRLLIQR